MSIKNFIKFITNIKRTDNFAGNEEFFREFLPPLKLNYNSSESNKDKYLINFTKKYREKIVPYLIDKNKNITPKIIDLGCGFSPLGISFLNYLLLNKKDQKEVLYVGIDINKTAIDWLKKKFENHKSFYFHEHNAPQDVNYISLGKEKNQDLNTLSDSDGIESKYNLPITYVPDFQLSGSFFTHLTSSAVNSALNFINEISSKNTLSINSWIIIDDESKESLIKKKADRVLDIDMGDYLTYSKVNPLLCTAYKIEKISEFYKKNGLEIIDISRGYWRGGKQKNIFNTKQDIIISRKI